MGSGGDDDAPSDHNGPNEDLEAAERRVVELLARISCGVGGRGATTTTTASTESPLPEEDSPNNSPSSSVEDASAALRELPRAAVVATTVCEWQCWGLLNKGPRWSGFREDLPAPLCHLPAPYGSDHCWPAAAR